VRHSTRSLRVLQVIDSLDIGGAERHAVALSIGLKGQGHEITVACSAGGSLAPELEERQIPICVLGPGPVKRRIDRTFAGRLRRVIATGHFDIVHAHLFGSVAAATLASIGLGTSLVITEHSEGGWRGPEEMRVSEQCYRHCSRVVAVSRSIEKRLLDVDGVPPDRTTVVLNACVVANGVPTTNLGRRSGPTIGVVARLEPEKGVSVFLAAAARVAATHPDVRFMVAGDGSQRTVLEAESRRLGLSESLRFVGAVPDSRAFISGLDVLVVPSLSEGTPLVVLEGMAASIPVVASNVGGIPDQIHSGRNGLLVPAAHPEFLSAAIARIIADPQLALALGRSGHRRVSLHFRHDSMVRQIEDVYRAATSGL
jgi:glycosyltransferase involved in cell wall biosynthesis